MMVTWCWNGARQRRGQSRQTRQPAFGEARSDQKVDAAVAMMMAIGRAMSENDLNPGLDR
jgi:phage terminase large subunit-like protein